MITTPALSDFISCLWDTEDIIEFRPIPSDKGKRVWLKAGFIAKYIHILKRENDNGAGIYAGVLPRRDVKLGTDADCLPGRVVWVDYDHIDIEGIYNTITDKELLKPSMIINSGHGIHLYYRLSKKIAPSRLCKLVGDMATHIGSDTSIKNPSRIMRVPGFMNHKKPVAECLILWYDANVIYDFDVLRKNVPESDDEEIKVSKADTVDIDIPVDNKEVFHRARKYIMTMKGRGEGVRNQTAFKISACLQNDFKLNTSESLQLLTEWNNTNTPPLPDKELKLLLISGKQNAKRLPGNKVSNNIITKANFINGREKLLSVFDKEASGEYRIIPFRYRLLNKMSNALKQGTLTIIGGSPSVGKSFFTTTIALDVHQENEKWMYLPLEDNKTEFQRRLLCLLANDWVVMNFNIEDARKRKEYYEFHREWLEKISTHVNENPSMPTKNGSGGYEIPKISYKMVLDWILEKIETNRVIFIDPLAQIDFGRNEWEGQSDFVRKLVGMTIMSKCSVVLVAHPIKRPGNNATLDLSLEDLQGSANLTRLAHTVLMFEAHDPKESRIIINGETEIVTHNRTMTIAKARNGSGNRRRLAYSMSMSSPEFFEHGLMTKNKAVF